MTTAPQFTYETGTLTYGVQAPEDLRGKKVQTYEILMNGRAIVHGTGSEDDARATLADMVARHTPTLVRFANGTSVTLPQQTADRVVGLSDEGYVVVEDDSGYRYGLTDCCHASAKGVEDGIACRSCYRDVDWSLGGPMDIAVPVAPQEA